MNRVVYEREEGMVWIIDGWVYKKQTEERTDREYACLSQMWKFGFVPWVERINPCTIRTAYIENERVKNAAEFMSHYDPVLEALRTCGIRHGDLSDYSVLVSGDRPVLIDFAESKEWDDPEPDKRAEGDAFWLMKTMRKLARV